MMMRVSCERDWFGVWQCVCGIGAFLFYFTRAVFTRK